MTEQRATPMKRFHRRGPQHRQAHEVSFLDIRRRFNFRSVALGRWVTEPEKQRAAGLFYDALCDLMAILKGPEALVSLRGTLALHYGIGGQLGVAAHYTPATRTFALAKNAGPGSIAHEWFHAFDHYIGDKAFSGVSASRFGSKAWLGETSMISHRLNNKLAQCYQAVMLSADGTGPSECFRHSVKRDKTLGTVYYSQPEELCARAFEAFVQDAEIKNAFLVNGTVASEDAGLGLYPQAEQRQRTNAAFGAYFGDLGRALSVASA
ncbi:CLCA_X family protein [Marinobacter caseinilyticus]|uniref:CLCA_X family protein n=1 Tax=Marinobacter caseinilyticus TaxID=2692195 RepID=UPI001F2982FB|nr:CLCA_X family protein [Marinobacter caseinilyticus]